MKLLSAAIGIVLVIASVANKQASEAAEADNPSDEKGQIELLPRKMPGLAVIAPKQFHLALADYIAHKSKQLPVELIALEDIRNEQSGDDDAEKVKHFLYGRWVEKRVAYVLLVGDIDVMPVRYRTITLGGDKKPLTYVFNITDHYYADVADRAGKFEDWNKLRDGRHRWLYCESRLDEPNPDVNADGIDFLPELAVGRWPVSTREAAGLIAKKTIRYESGLEGNEKPGGRRAAMLIWTNDLGWDPGWGAALNGWESATYNFSATELKPNAGLVTQQLNQGLGLIIDIGHGESNGWTDFKKRNLADLRNADCLPIIFSIGCDTAPLGPGTLPVAGYRDRNRKTITAKELAKANPPTPPDVYQARLRKETPLSFGQQMVIGSPDGAVAYIGFTINSNHWHQLMEGFTMAVGKHPAPRLGDAWNFSLIHHHRARQAFVEGNKGNFDGLHSFDQGLRVILIGDPTLLLPSVP